jgi:hypothetical protein
MAYLVQYNSGSPFLSMTADQQQGICSTIHTALIPFLLGSRLASFIIPDHVFFLPVYRAVPCFLFR